MTPPYDWDERARPDHFFRGLVVGVALGTIIWSLLILAFLWGTDAAGATTTKTVYCPGFECYGTNQADKMIGARTWDFLFANAGDDLVKGRGGADMLDAGKGADQVVGGGGRDDVYGGSGADWIDVQDGHRDVVHCGPGKDFVQMDLGLDEVHGCEFHGGVA